VAKFGPYELLQKLGTGATAEVHLATGPNRAGATLFALKILLQHLSERTELKDQLLREARLASSIHHPNVAEVFDVGEAEERAYLAMEYVRGRPLSALLRKMREAGEGLSVAEACFVVREAALGLHEAHEVVDARRRPLGLVHRDVSPQNVMVREDGRIKVVDFGLAKVTASEEAIAFTAGGPGIKGKIPYMPPEQVRNEPLDRRADVFAACAMLFELVCGRRLYPGETEAELIQQALSLPQTDPVELAPELPAALVEVMRDGLERDASRRTASAAALAEALGRFVAEDAKGDLARRMERFFDPMPRTVDEARMAAMAQRTSGLPLGAVRPITRSRPGAGDTRPRTPEEQERTTLAAAFPSQTLLKTDPANTDPSATAPHRAEVQSREVDLPTVAEIPPPELPMIQAEVTGPVSDAARLQALMDPTTVEAASPEPPPTDVRPVLDDPTRPKPVADVTAPRPAADPTIPKPVLPPPRPPREYLSYVSEESPSFGESPSFTPTPAKSPPPRRRVSLRSMSLAEIQRLPVLSRLSTQQTVIALAAVAALGGLGVGFLLKQLTGDDPPPRRAPVVERGGSSPVERAPLPPRVAEGPRGQVVILAEPMAVVTENGRELGTTPYVGQHSAGTHQFLLRAVDGVGTALVEIEIHAGEQITRRVTLR
jgi:eukaryotic-like serine/threonine-protein kinase